MPAISGSRPVLSRRILTGRTVRILALAAVAVAAILGYRAWSGHGERQKPRVAAAQPVVVAPVAVKAVPIEITTIGHVQPIASVSVRSRIQGQIARVLVRDGQEVKAGDVLFNLDDRQARAQLEQAQGVLMKDRAQLKFAQQEVARYSSLASKSFASGQQLQQAQGNAGALEGTVKADEAQIANLETQLSFTVIRAPIDGRAGTVLLKEGNTVDSNGGAPLVVLNQLHPIYAGFAVPQRDLARVQEAMEAGPVKVTAVAPDSGQAPEVGEIAYIDNAIDNASSTLSVKARFDNADNRLWPGQFVNVAVTLKIDPNARLVPSEAVQTGQDGFYVYVVTADNTAELRTVTVGPQVGSETVIDGGVAPGERVVTTGQLRLKNGTKVQVTDAAGGEPTPAGKPKGGAHPSAPAAAGAPS